MGSSPPKTASSTSSPSLNSPSSAINRDISFPTLLVHHPPARRGDTHHLVSLTSTSYGFLLLIDLHEPKTASDPSRFKFGLVDILITTPLISTWGRRKKVNRKPILWADIATRFKNAQFLLFRMGFTNLYFKILCNQKPKQNLNSNKWNDVYWVKGHVSHQETSN